MELVFQPPRSHASIADEPAVSPEDLYTKFFTLSMDMLALAGVDGYFKVLNGAWTDTLGFTDEELLSRPYLDFVHPDDQAATIAEASKLADGFPTIHFRNRYRCKDGAYRWLAWTATAAMADGTIYAAARDVTGDVLAEDEARQRTQEQLTRVQAALAGDAIRRSSSRSLICQSWMPAGTRPFRALTWNLIARPTNGSRTPARLDFARNWSCAPSAELWRPLTGSLIAHSCRSMRHLTPWWTRISAPPWPNSKALASWSR
jgi:PAS domain S-box-containing protein